jgi:hypothetical protein
MSVADSDRHDREGKRLVAFHAHEPVHRAVRTLAAEQGTTNTALLYEAVGLLLTAHGKPLPSEIEAVLADQRRDKFSTTLGRLVSHVEQPNRPDDPRSDDRPAVSWEAA